MKKKVRIPKGWYRLRTGCNVRAGDKEFDWATSWLRLNKRMAEWFRVRSHEAIIRRKKGGAR